MRLLVLGDALAPHTRRWAQWFARRGHQVDVATFNPEVLPDFEPATVHVLWDPAVDTSQGNRAMRMLTIQRRLRRLVRRLEPDVVHAHSVGGYAWAAKWLGFQPYVLSPWGTDILVDVRESRVNRLLTTSALKKSPLVITDGFHFVELLEDLGVDRERIEVLTFGTDTKRFTVSGDDDARLKWGYVGYRVVISTRTPNPVHDVDCFVRAIPQIHDSFPDARFIIVGDGTELEVLKSLAADLHVADYCRFTGMVDEATMRDLLSLSDVYVSTSLMDAGLAGSTAEAMAMGLPVVQTDNSDNSYWAPHGVGGALFPNGDHARLAEVVCSMLADPDSAKAMGRRNREKICAEYDTDTQMAKVENLYQSLTGR